MLYIVGSWKWKESPREDYRRWGVLTPSPQNTLPPFPP